MMACHTRDRSDAMAKGTFGEHLKRERELREVSLDEVAKATRIARRFLEALENEQWEKLPGGVFGRGFVRSVARYLGLSEESLLSEYDLARGESASPPPQKAEERIPSPPRWIPVAVALLLFALLAGVIVGGRYAWKAYQAHRAQKRSSAILSLPAAGQTRTVRVLTTSAAGGMAAGPAAAALDLSVLAAMPTRVRVVADGNVVFDAQRPSGENRRLSAAGRTEVTAADASAVLLELNGQTVAPLSPPGSSATIVLTQRI
jgi:cytoskeleton protein RodZ